MCIRDSARKVWNNLLRVIEIEGKDEVDKKKFYTNLYRVYVCLLYTSDAADERSSVDLGGRRIIKKKNRICICEREDSR